MMTEHNIVLLSQLLVGLAQLNKCQECEISGMAIDSREIQQGYLFFACASVGGRKKDSSHGLNYAVNAANKGAVVIVFDSKDQSYCQLIMEKIITTTLATMNFVALDNLQENMGVIASRFYQNPSSSQFIIAITGTNGKTSCSHFLAQILAARKGVCGLIGTLGYGLYGHLKQASHTTPDAVKLQSELATIYNAGADQVVMEVSSHALDQKRVTGVAIDVAVLTNLSHEHLDYHQDMERYAEAKQRLFTMPGISGCVINYDDDFGRNLLHILSTQAALQVLSYGFDQAADIHVQEYHFNAQGFTLKISTPWGQGQLCSALLGRFNASNLLAVLTTLLIMGGSLQQALMQIKKIRPVTGRMENFGGRNNQPLVVIDYAHTPDALKQVLKTLREHCRGQLWCVFGCGGDRDRDKRSAMGAIAEQEADHVIITDDNPRYEAGDSIVTDILAGFHLPQHVKVQRDRAAAIRLAVQSAKAGDIVLVAGKGHENYQLVGDEILPFSDQQQVTILLGDVA